MTIYLVCPTLGQTAYGWTLASPPPPQIKMPVQQMEHWVWEMLPCFCMCTNSQAPRQMHQPIFCCNSGQSTMNYMPVLSVVPLPLYILNMHHHNYFAIFLPNNHNAEQHTQGHFQKQSRYTVEMQPWHLLLLTLNHYYLPKYSLS